MPSADRKIGEVADVHSAYRDGKVLVFEPFALADGTLYLAHVLLYLAAGVFAVCFGIAPFKVVYNSLKGRAV